MKTERKEGEAGGRCTACYEPLAKGAHFHEHCLELKSEPRQDVHDPGSSLLCRYCDRLTMMLIATPEISSSDELRAALKAHDREALYGKQT